MNKKILIFLVFLTAIFALGALFVSASDNNDCEHIKDAYKCECTVCGANMCVYNGDEFCDVCGFSCSHFNMTYETIYTDDIDDVCSIYRCFCPDCGYGYDSTFPHNIFDSVCTNEGCDAHYHIWENGVCQYSICGIECSHNWSVVDIEYTYERLGDCYIETCVCDICGMEWSNGFGHQPDENNDCENCHIYTLCVHDFGGFHFGDEQLTCRKCGASCDHEFEGGYCYKCLLICPHIDKTSVTKLNESPDPSDYCEIQYEQCNDCGEYLYYRESGHDFVEGRCEWCGVSLDGVICTHQSLKTELEGFTKNQNSYCYRILKQCDNCRYYAYENVAHEYIDGVCKNCKIEFVSGLEEQIKQQGYNDGKSEGLNEGYTNGYNDGKSEGYDNGVKEGYAEGKTDGYREGIQAASDGEMGNLFYELFNAEVNVFQKMLNFEIFGINIATFLMSILSILVIAWIIKKVI